MGRGQFRIKLTVLHQLAIPNCTYTWLSPST